MTEATAMTPPPVLGIYDRKMWAYINQKDLHLQCCLDCGATQYPPTPGCSKCLSINLQWKPVSGHGKIISWAIFHKQYLSAYPAPYNVIAVKLKEGPVMISNLEGDQPQGSWINTNVHLTYTTMQDGIILPRFKMVSKN